MSTISGTVTQTVVLGSGGYSSPLTITGTGVILPAMAGADGIMVPAGLHHARITNDGQVSGAAGSFYGATLDGGIAVYMAAAGKLTNAGTITGGDGGVLGYPYETGTGGAGIDMLAGGRLANTGIIAGGNGGEGNTGGDGAQLTGGTLSNSGTIIGGVGGGGPYGAGYGGSGLLIDDGRAQNSGVIAGGAGGSGVTGGGGGVGVYSDGSKAFHNAGAIFGGSGGDSQNAGGNGGTGIILTSALSNTGTITGGAGGDGYYKSGYGGVGVLATGGPGIHNSGVIAGGSGGEGKSGGDGGAGIVLQTAATNTGTIMGGAGGYQRDQHVEYTVGGTGGVGAVVTANANLVNAGLIIGGAGSYNVETGNSGGAGVVLQSGTLTNSGTIVGGQGGNSGGSMGGGPGGYGVVLDGGTLIDAGTIVGGAGGVDALGGMGGPNTAISVGDQGGTLELDPSAVLIGNLPFEGYAGTVRFVLANTTSGTEIGTLSAFGYGDALRLSSFSVAADAVWTMTSLNYIEAPLEDSGTLLVAGNLSCFDRVEVKTDATLGVGGSGTFVSGGPVILSGGTLTADPAGAILIGGGETNAGTINITAQGTIGGDGLVAAPAILDDGAIVAQDGKLALSGTMTGDGAAFIGTGGTLILHNGASGVQLIFSDPGKLVLGDASAVSSAIGGFAAGDLIDVETIAANGFGYQNGTLTLLNGSSPLDTLVFNGSYTASDFAIASDKHGGTTISFVPSAASAMPQALHAWSNLVDHGHLFGAWKV